MQPAQSRALIVIDVQNEYFDGALPVTSPPPDTSLANIRTAMDAATAASLPVIVVQHEELEADAEVFRPGSHGAELHPEINTRPRDHLVKKSLPGSFTNTQLAEILEAAGIDTVTLTGYMTHMCVDTTARQAVHRGLNVEILTDATGTVELENAGGQASAEDVHRVTIVAQGDGLADVVSTDEWLARISAAK